MKYIEERSQPLRDLLISTAHLQPRKIVDLGCGPGNSTVLLRESFPKSQVEGVDSSQAMIGAARSLGTNLTFQIADVATWTPPPETDMLFSNAMFHWLPDHPHHMQRLFSAMTVGGALAVQMPDNLGEPSHVLMSSMAQSPRWAFSLLEISHQRQALLAAHEYHQLLSPLAQSVKIWRTTYYHVLDDHGAIAKMLSTTGLKPYLDALSAADREIFMTEYVNKLASCYPAIEGGKVLYPFPRLFIVAIRAGS